MSVSPWVKEALGSAGLAFREVSHAAARSAQGLAQREHFSGRAVAKVVVVLADEKPILLVLPATHRVAPARVKEILGGKPVRFALEEEMRALFPDCELGAEPPLRHWPGVDLWMDPAMRVAGEILFAGGTREDGVRMRFDDWLQAARPREETFAEPLGYGAAKTETERPDLEGTS